MTSSGGDGPAGEGGSGTLFPVEPKASLDPAQARKHREIPDPPALKRHGPARVISLCNQKGGVGKTTSAINLGAALAELGRRVLLVDFDPQGALSVGLGVSPHQLERTTYNLLMERGVGIDDVLLKTGVPGIDLLPSNIDLSAAEIQLVGEVAREQTLARALAPVLPDYDYVLIDCQPSLGLLTVNALTASHGVIIPLECEFFSLRGVALLIDTIEKVQERLNPQLKLDGILATMYDGRTNHGREVFSRVRRGVRRHRVRHRHHPHRPLPGDHRRGRADHLVGAELDRRQGLPRPRPRGHRPLMTDAVDPGRVAAAPSPRTPRPSCRTPWRSPRSRPRPGPAR